MLSGLLMVLASIVVAGDATAQAQDYCVPQGPRVALTFDDGPWSDFTPKVLEILQEKEVLATFFVVGQRVRASPGVLLMVHQSGHEIGLHTDSHKLLVNLSRPDQDAQLQRNYDSVRSVLPDAPIRFWRAPYGALPNPRPSAAANLGLRHQGWSVDTEDWRRPGQAVYFLNVSNRLRDGAVILMHEHTADTRAFLPRLIDELKEKGYQFVILSDLNAPTCLDNTLVGDPEPAPESINGS